MGNVWRAWIMALIGAWFFISGWVFATQVGEFVTFGGLILIGAIWTALDRPAAQGWRSWLMALFSAWLAISPWTLGYAQQATATYTTLIVGVVGVILAIWTASTQEAAPVKTQTGGAGTPQAPRKAG